MLSNTFVPFTNLSSRIPAKPPKILPVENSSKRPLWSVMIPAYNCIDYLQKCIESVLVQDEGPEEMQIEVVDDLSTDGDVEELVRRIGIGRVSYYKQSENKGSLRNFETCINRSKGYYIHLLHGDDWVKPGFYKEIESLFKQSPKAGSAITNHYTYFDLDIGPQKSLPIQYVEGLLDNWLYKIASFQYLQPPAVVVKREVYESLGSFFAVHYGEDWEMWVRIAAHYQVAYSPKCLAVYRGHHSTNISTKYISTGKNFDDLEKVIDIINNYLPESKRKKYRNKARRNFSICFARASTRIYKRDKKTALVLAQRSLKMHKNWRTIMYAMNCFIAFKKDSIF